MYRNMTFVFAAAVALVANGADARGPKGPRGSVSASTVCELKLTDTTATFDVEIRLADKSSGAGVPVGVSTVVDLAGKDSPGRWEYQPVLATELGGVFDILPATITESFDLCAVDLTGIRALNALVALTYHDGNETERTINNRCSDDPATLKIEPAGIKIDPDEIALICNY